ncbi:hypothetical protein [Sorangium sp. So ce1000]|uniref:hypothetical protein n=1 Tax=Sorangium sp. So ce1000 TaxID=3133325 RepID=UPI003F62848F
MRRATCDARRATCDARRATCDVRERWVSPRADAVAALVEAPAGKRPLRTIVGGSGQALAELNAVAERLQAEALRAQGLGHLLEVVTPG